VIIDPYTGNIVAMSGGVGEKTKSRLYNLATMSERPAGSSIKPIAVYAPAMDLGLITPDTRFEDSEDVTLKGTTWMTKNAGGGYTDGVVTVRTALRRSINTVAAQILDLLTPAVSFDFMINKLHFTTLVPEDEDYAPLALGQLTYGATVREMATAYCIFPNEGVYTSSRTYTRITDADGNLIFDNEPETNIAISDVTAYWITDMLQEAATSGTGYEAKLSGMPTAGKTGTTTENKDRWFIGYTLIMWPPSGRATRIRKSFMSAETRRLSSGRK
jgi:penicillin-binding protein 1A